jgi:haloacid dehalogenase superfamily, subfamily IA, variant 3 with third motif having DD or ED
MIKAILFDMDGVLYNSMPWHTKAWKDALAEIGIEASIEDFYLCEGRTGKSTVNIYFNRDFGRDATEEECNQIYKDKSNRFTELENGQVQVMPGALDVLQKVKDMGSQRVIVTGSGQQSLFDKVASHFPGFFSKDKMVTAYDVKYGKPNPESYLMGLEKAGVKPEEAIVIENAPLGVEAGRAAGIFTIAVNTGPLDDKVLLDAGANLLFPSMIALSEQLEEIVNQFS